MINTAEVKRTTKIFSVIVLMAVILIANPSLAQMTMNAKESTKSTNAAMLKTEMRKLWEDHIVWTRNVIFCLVDELPGTDQVVKRLLQNQVSIGDAIKPYYGEEAGKKLTELLYEHINIAAEVIKVAKEGNATALDEANIRWNANANEISEFLCKANPNWKLADMKMMMSDHLKLTTDQVIQRIKKNYDADIIAYDKVHEEILKMSDMISDGIIQQFSEKFTTIINKKVAEK